ncbi:hypothetical protein ACFV4N_12300 [Actinosynnema sp. NPDC059797]
MVHVLELVLFTLAVTGVLVLAAVYATTPLYALLLVLVLLFGVMLASRAEPKTLGAWLRRLLDRLFGGSGGV